MLDTGENEILITSLMDKTLYPTEIFAALYHERWPVEEDYKIMKCRMEMEAFTGQSVRSIYQDFHANVFAKNLVAMLTFSVLILLRNYGHLVKPLLKTMGGGNYECSKSQEI
jgi:hypothetical protein